MPQKAKTLSPLQKLIIKATLKEENQKALGTTEGAPLKMLNYQSKRPFLESLISYHVYHRMNI